MSNIRIADSHIHIFPDKMDFNVDKIYLLNATDLESSYKVVDYCQKWSNLVGFVGFHPYFVDNHSEADLQRLESILKKNVNLNVGEIGLDKTKKGSRFDKQLSFFDFQLDLAIKNSRLVSIHCVRSFDILYGIFKHKGVTGISGLLHRFEGSYEDAIRCVDYGLMLSINPNIHRHPSQIEVFKKIPLNRIILETDAVDYESSLSLEDHYKKCSGYLDISSIKFKELVYKNISRLLSL